MQVHPRKFLFRENPGKITTRLGKICENLCKIIEKSVQTPQKYNKNGVKRAFSCEIGAKSHEDIFLEVIENPVFMQCIKDGPKFFRASFGKFWQKSFAP